MFSEVVKLIPSIDRAGLNRMFQTLNQRFTSVAKKFGQGMKNAFKLAPIIAIGSALIAKLLNPLEKAEEIINRITAKGDDAVTSAEELGTEAGKLLRLEAIGTAKGIDADTMRLLLGKFQSALAKEQEAAKDPKSKPGTLRNFVGEKDTADAFFKFIQVMQKIGETDKSRQVVVQSEIFGEKVRGKASELFNATDFESILRQLPSVEQLTAAAQKSGRLADMKDLLTAIRENKDFVTKSGLVNETQIKALDQSAGLNDRADNQTLRRFNSLKSASISIQELTEKFDNLATWATDKLFPAINDGLAGMNKITDFLDKWMGKSNENKAAGNVSLGEIPTETAASQDILLFTLKEWGGKMETMWSEFKQSRLYKNPPTGKRE